MMMHRRDLQFVTAQVITEHGEQTAQILFRTPLGAPLLVGITDADARNLRAYLNDMARGAGWLDD
jgi:hypothetical protein